MYRTMLVDNTELSGEKTQELVAAFMNARTEMLISKNLATN